MAAGLEAPPAGAARPFELAGARLLLLALERGRRPGFELWAPAAGLDALEAALVEAGAERASAAAFETLRVEAGELAFGIDYGPESFPQESGDEAPSPTRRGATWARRWWPGCAGAGRPQRIPRGLRFPEALPPARSSSTTAARPAARPASPAPPAAARSASRCSTAGSASPRRASSSRGGVVAELRPLPFA